MTNTCILNNQQIHELINVKECIPIIEKLFSNLALSQMPPKIYLEIPHGDFRAMPAVVGDTAGIKWCGVHLDDKEEKRKCNIFAKVLINDINTGKLLAIMDGEAITAIRTAAVTGVATKYLANDSARVATFVGCGTQTSYQIDAILAVTNLDKIILCDLDKDRAEELAKLYDIAEVVDSLIDAVSEADILTTLTPSKIGFIKHEWLKPIVHINAIGADAKGKRELDCSILDNIDLLVYDNWEQCSHSGEIQYVSSTDAQQLWVDLESVVADKQDMTGYDQTVFDATGLAIEDIITARYIYDKQNILGI